jgi:hypothetical protein
MVCGCHKEAFLGGQLFKVPAVEALVQKTIDKRGVYPMPVVGSPPKIPFSE